MTANQTYNDGTGGGIWIPTETQPGGNDSVEVGL